jgi:hypothetical protein
MTWKLFVRIIIYSYFSANEYTIWARLIKLCRKRIFISISSYSNLFRFVLCVFVFMASLWLKIDFRSWKCSFFCNKATYIAFNINEKVSDYFFFYIFNKDFEIFYNGPYSISYWTTNQLFTCLILDLGLKNAIVPH